MTDDPRMRPDPSNATPPWNPKTPDRATAFFPAEQSQKVTQLVQELTAHGGGSASVGLAFDLVLHDIVEQARHGTGANGAAIALLREDEMVCRATTGESAPDLGVRVDTSSGLAGACLSTGQIQQCRDTDTDARVNAEACRRLGVRSMLIAPLVEDGKVFGILQVFSAWPNAFGEREVSTLEALARKAAESKKEAEASAAVPPGVEEDAHVTPSAMQEKADLLLDQAPVSDPYANPFAEEEMPRSREIWPSILVVLVICVAVLLGLVVGWRGAAKDAVRNPQSAVGSSGPDSSGPRTDSSQSSAAQSQLPQTPADAAPANTDSAPIQNSAIPLSSPQPPSGGLLVTENGKVIYRSSPGANAATPAAAPRPATRLIHRVEPQYPEQAKAQKIQGPVVLSVQIGGDGAVSNVDVVSGDPILADAAVQALKQWRFKPYFVDGHAVGMQTRITVKFTLPPS